MQTLTKTMGNALAVLKHTYWEEAKCTRKKTHGRRWQVKMSNINCDSSANLVILHLSQNGPFVVLRDLCHFS